MKVSEIKNVGAMLETYNELSAYKIVAKITSPKHYMNDVVKNINRLFTTTTLQCNIIKMPITIQILF